MKNISIIFDDGPRQPLCEIVDKIKNFGWSSGFAVVGKKINDETEYMLKYAIDNGFQLLSHGHNHIFMDKLDKADIANEFLLPISEIKKRIGYNVTMARLPFLTGNDKVFEVAKELKLPLFGQGIGLISDWEATTEPKNIYDVVTSTVSDGAIACLHVSKNTCIALDEILPALKKMGYNLLTPEDLIRISGATIPLGVQIENVNLYTEQRV